MKLASSAPAIPSTVVKMNPFGLFSPGMIGRAMMPATKPIRTIQRNTPMAVPQLALRSRQSDLAFGAENIAVEVCDPLPSARRDIEITDGGLHVRRNRLPVKLWIEFGQIRRRLVAELPVQSGFLEFIIKCVCFPQILRVAELPDEIGGAHQRALLGAVADLVDRDREARELDRAGDPGRIEIFAAGDTVHDEQLRPVDVILQKRG